VFFVDGVDGDTEDGKVGDKLVDVVEWLVNIALVDNGGTDAGGA
jgi:hypothetical protein